VRNSSGRTSSRDPKYGDSYTRSKTTSDPVRLSRRHLRSSCCSCFGSGALIDEAFNLTMGDLDLSSGSVTLRRSHSGRVRTIPIGPALRRALAAHASGRALNERLFQGRRGGQIRRINLIRAFQRACLCASIRTLGANRITPTLRELRNTFAVHCIERWVKSGAEIHQMMPVLSGYMGHVEPRSTEQYLRFVPSRFVEPLAKLATPKLLRH
jgi:integrase/recombinase XerD